MVWKAAEFHEWFSKISDPEKMQRALNELTKDQAKEYLELQTFNHFAKASTLDIDPRTIENRKAPEPDIYCEVSRHGHYFELGELTDQHIPRNAAEAKRAGSDVHGGPVSQANPLEKMVFEKCSKSYSLNDGPASLLLHFSVGHQVPNPMLLTSFLSQHHARIVEALKMSAFDSIWFYDAWSDSVPGVVER